MYHTLFMKFDKKKKLTSIIKKWCLQIRKDRFSGEPKRQQNNGKT